MSTEYELGSGYVAVESSSRISVGIIQNENSPEDRFHDFGESMNELELRRFIVELVKSCSYVSDDPEATLKRFNVDYSHKE